MAHLSQLVPSRKELRAISHRFGSLAKPPRRSRSQQALSKDPGWIGTVEQPFETVEDARIRLEELEAAFRGTGDRRSIFLTVYTEMTGAVETGLGSGFFADPAWVEELLVNFANHYRRAVVAYEREETHRVPAPWEIGFDATLGGETLVLQDALFGVNAHINYDLTYALEEVGIDPDRGRKFDDYNRINRVLDRLVDTVQDALVDVYEAANVATLDPLLGPLDEELVFYGLKSGRGFAWDNAEVLADFDGPIGSTCIDWRVTNVSTGIAKLIRSPGVDPSASGQFLDAEKELAPIEAFRTAFRGKAPSGDPALWTAPP